MEHKFKESQFSPEGIVHIRPPPGIFPFFPRSCGYCGTGGNTKAWTSGTIPVRRPHGLYTKVNNCQPFGVLYVRPRPLENTSLIRSIFVRCRSFQTRVSTLVALSHSRKINKSGMLPLTMYSYTHRFKTGWGELQSSTRRNILRLVWVGFHYIFSEFGETNIKYFILIQDFH